MKYYAFIYRALIIMSVGFLMLQGCKKGGETDKTPTEFEMVEYTVQDGVDTEGNPKKRVTFQLSGTEGLDIAFFSGDIGGNYEYRDGRVQELTDLNLSFDAECIPGAAQGCETFSVLASTNFNGGDQVEDVENATWQNITDRFTIVSGASQNAGTANIVDVTEEGKPLYLALRHITYAQTVTLSYSTIRIKNWLVTSHIEGVGPATLVDGHMSAEAGFYHVLKGNWIAGRNQIRAADLTFRGNHGSNTEYWGETECWAISAPITIGDIHIEADLPLRVKQSHQPAVKTFAFNYNGPGEYNAVFVLTKGDGEAVTKAMTISIPE